MSDNVKHPSHYAEGRKFEPKDVIRDWGLNFNMGNAVKYLSRAGRKGDIVEDLKKAQQYIQFELEALGIKRSATDPQHINCKCSVKPVEEDLPALAELLEMNAMQFVGKYCKKGLHSCMIQKFKAGSKVYFISSVRVEDEGVVKKVILKLDEKNREAVWAKLLTGNMVRDFIKNSIEITLEG
jgi:hypothetical protein